MVSGTSELLKNECLAIIFSFSGLFGLKKETKLMPISQPKKRRYAFVLNTSLGTSL